MTLRPNGPTISRSGDLIQATSGLIDVQSGFSFRGARLIGEVESRADYLRSLQPGLAVLRFGRNLEDVFWYLAAFRSRRPIALVDPAVDTDTYAALVRGFRPAVLISSTRRSRPENWPALPVGQAALATNPSAASPVHGDLAVLLQTSGSTGSPRMVRLSRSAVLHNSQAIGTVLHITEEEVAPTALPLFYSFGLSVLNSHLAAGATVAVMDETIGSSPFYGNLIEAGATSLSGVPSTFQILRLTRWNAKDFPRLRTLNQAGGRLPEQDLRHFISDRIAVQGRFHVMWGQTEASPRMTTMPWESLIDRLGSVGRPLPGGRVTVVDRELIYSGPNVMMGYADESTDLARGDDLGGRLNTGDLGEVDSEGFVWLTGRAKRIAKLFGIRYDLDELERVLNETARSALTAEHDSLVVHALAMDGDAAQSLRYSLAQRLAVPATVIRLNLHEVLPLLPSGKIDYRALDP